MPSTVVSLALSLCAALVIQKFLAYRRGIASIGHFPDKFFILARSLIVANITRQIKYLAPGGNIHFEDKYRPFKEVGWDVYALTSVVPRFEAIIMIADAEVAKEVLASRSRFPKNVYLYIAINFYGTNIVSSEGEEWKKYRKICSPAFNDSNYALVWNETISTVQGLFDDLWKNKDVIHVDNCVSVTLPIALFIIGAAGFGRKISWMEDEVIPPGYTMSFKEAIHVVASNTVTKLMIPDRLSGATAFTRKVTQGFKELRMYMSDMIHERRLEDKAGRHDLLSTLLDANNDALDVSQLTDAELIGNVYIFLLAGHETTAHTLAFTFALLALYPDEQEKLFEHIKSVTRDGRNPSFEQMSELTYSAAVFYETLRMFPPVGFAAKIASEDTQLTTRKANGDSFTIPIPKGTEVEVNIAALHYNPRYWKDPETFRPARFLEKDWPRDAFLPFSGGARACLGRKFFETEGLAILSMIVSQYKISVMDEPKFRGETFEQRKNRILGTHVIVTLTPNRIPLTFTKRN